MNATIWTKNIRHDLRGEEETLDFTEHGWLVIRTPAKVTFYPPQMVVRIDVPREPA